MAHSFIVGTQTVDEARLARLPQWAQALIAQLERDRSQARQQLRSYLDHSEFAEDKYGTIHVPERKQLQLLGDITVTAFGRDHERYVEITGEGGLIVRPRASNVAWVKAAHWQDIA